MNPLPLVKTDLGMMPVNRAAAVQQIATDYESRRQDRTMHQLETDAAALGIKLAEVRALWNDGPALVERAIKAAVAKIPPAIFQATYLCAGCKKVRDDKYIAKCKRKQRTPCWIGARLRGCHRFEAAPVFVGATA